MNWEKAITKMRRLAGYWSQFGLSIAGRVMVAKTYILSQCIYLMGSIPMSDEIGGRVNEILLNYVKGRDRLIERRRQLLNAELGGYGLMSVCMMNVCIKASWIEKWKRENMDNDYMAATIWSNRDALDSWRIVKSRVTGKGLPIMEDIVENWLKFKRKFYEWGNNINKAELFGNDALVVDDQRIDEVVLGNERYRELEQRLQGKRVEAICTMDGAILDKIEVDRNLGIRLSWVEYFRLRTLIARVRVEFSRKTEGLCTELTVDEFVGGKKRGCKRYRRIMEGRWSNVYRDNSPENIAAGGTLWGEYMIQMGRGLVENNYGLWACAVLESGFKDFLFRLVHGKLT